jgi:hypothetical protein
MIVKTRVLNPVEILPQYQLEDWAAQLLKENPSEFYTRCGDLFVAGRQTGGEFLGVVDFMSRTEGERNEISLRIAAAGTTWRAGVQIDSLTQRLSSLTRIHMQLFRNGSVQAVPASIGDMINAANAFPPQVSSDTNRAAVMSLLLIDYGVVANLTSTPINSFDALATLEELGTMKAQYLQLRDTAAYPIQRDVTGAYIHLPEFAPGVDVRALQTLVDQLNGDLAQISSAAETCVRAPENCTKPLLTPPSVNLPQRLERHGINQSNNGRVHFYSNSIDEARCCGFTVERYNEFYLAPARFSDTQMLERITFPEGYYRYDLTTCPSGNCHVLGFISITPVSGTIPLYTVIAGQDQMLIADPSEAEEKRQHGYTVTTLGYVWTVK